MHSSRRLLLLPPPDVLQCWLRFLSKLPSPPPLFPPVSLRSYSSLPVQFLFWNSRSSLGLRPVANAYAGGVPRGVWKRKDGRRSGFAGEFTGLGVQAPGELRNAHA